MNIVLKNLNFMTNLKVIEYEGKMKTTNPEKMGKYLRFTSLTHAYILFLGNFVLFFKGINKTSAKNNVLKCGELPLRMISLSNFFQNDRL